MSAGCCASGCARKGRRFALWPAIPSGREDLKDAGCEVVRADVLEPETLGPALEGVDVAYYLVHSMGRGSDGDFAERDHRGAENFAAAAAAAGVRRIVYLGGLGEGSKHLDSRHQTAEALRRARSPSSISAPPPCSAPAASRSAPPSTSSAGCRRWSPRAGSPPAPSRSPSPMRSPTSPPPRTSSCRSSARSKSAAPTSPPTAA